MIESFSERARKRLLNWVNQIDREQVQPDCLWFITLTYPEVWPADPDRWKKHLAALKKRIERHWEQWGTIWKLEPQKRGAPHWHLMAIVPEGRAEELKPFRVWLAQAWYEVCGTNDPRHLAAGTRVVRARKWRKALSYVSRYIAKKTPGFINPLCGTPLRVGRYWGVWRPELFPIRLVAVKLPPAQFQKVCAALFRSLNWCEPQRPVNQRMFVDGAVTQALINAVLSELTEPPYAPNTLSKLGSSLHRMWRPPMRLHRGSTPLRRIPGQAVVTAPYGQRELILGSEQELATDTCSKFCLIRGPPYRLVAKPEARAWRCHARARSKERRGGLATGPEVPDQP